MPLQTSPFHALVGTRNPRHQIVRTGPEFEVALRYLDACEALVVDTETSGLRWFAHAGIVGLALGGRDSSGVLRAFYFPLRHRTGEAQFEISTIHRAISDLLQKPSLKIGHNLKFDEHILRKEGWRLGGKRADTMIGARLYDENRHVALKERAVADLGISEARDHERELSARAKEIAKANKLGITEYLDRYGYSQIPIGMCGEYSCYDIEYTALLYDLYTSYHIQESFPRIWNTESDLVSVLCDAEETGMPIDVDYLQRLRASLQGYQGDVLRQVEACLGRRGIELSRDEIVRTTLQSLGCVLTKTTLGGQLAVDHEVLESFSQKHPAIPLILAWREAEKLRSTYTGSILERLDAQNILHPDFQQVGTETGRLSCRQPNFQNQPADSNDRALRISGKSLEDGGVDPWSIRRAYLTRGPGWLRLFFDYSQIELRVLAFYTRDPIMVEAYLAGEDIHSRTSLEVFGTKEKSYRRISKVINFGLSYGMSSKGLSRQAGIAPDEAEAFLARFFERYKGVARFKPIFYQQVKRQKCCFQNLFGRPRRLPDLASPDRYVRGAAERKAIATLIQGTAAELTKESLVRISQFFAENGLSARIVATVHDEIQVDCPIEEMPEVARGVQQAMENFPEFDPIPIEVDGMFTLTNWSEKKKLPLERKRKPG